MKNLSIYMKVPIVLISALMLMFLPQMACALDTGLIPTEPVKVEPTQDVSQAVILPGDVRGIAVGTVLEGLRAVQNWLALGGPQGAYGILGNGQQYIIWFQMKEGVGFIALDAKGNPVDLANQFLQGGNYINSATFRALLQSLKQQGWTALNAIPPAVTAGAKELVEIMKNATGKIPYGARWLQTPAIFIMPVDVLEDIQCFPACTQSE